MAVEWKQYTCNGVCTVLIIGSNDLRDWVYNFRTMRTIGDSERVNRMDRAEALCVLRSLRDESCVRAWHVHGHSRGGAIAQIVARELARRSDHVHLQTYGTKRAGNRRFVQRIVLETESCEFTRNRGDLVPFLPPWYARLPCSMTIESWGRLFAAHVFYRRWNLECRRLRNTPMRKCSI